MRATDRFATWFFLVSFWGVSTPTLSFADICSTPAESICAFSQAVTERRRELQAHWTARALEETQNAFAVNRGVLAALKRVENPKPLPFADPEDVKDFEQASRAYYRRLRQEMDLNELQLREYFVLHQELIKQAIERQAFPLTVRDEMMNRVFATQFLAFERGVAGEVQVEGQWVRDLFAGFLDLCGADGWRQTAINRSVKIELPGVDLVTGLPTGRPGVGHVVMACPRLYAAAYDETAKEYRPTAIMLHELGHSLDDKYFAQTYEPLVRGWEKRLPVHKLWPVIGTKPEPVSDHVRELIADHWSAEGLAVWLDREPAAERVALATAALGSRCEMVPSRGHPPGRLRIDFILENASLRRALNCPAL